MSKRTVKCAHSADISKCGPCFTQFTGDTAPSPALEGEERKPPLWDDEIQARGGHYDNLDHEIIAALTVDPRVSWSFEQRKAVRKLILADREQTRNQVLDEVLEGLPKEQSHPHMTRDYTRQDRADDAANKVICQVRSHITNLKLER